jgi:hypothetical protein
MLWLSDKKWAWKGIRISLEALCGHLPEVHFILQSRRLGIMLAGSLSYAGITVNQKILFCPQAVKGEVAHPPDMTPML